MSRYKNKHIAILGLSVEGVDSATFFHQEEARITCCDRRSKEELGETYTALTKYTSDFRLGPNYLNDLDRFDMVVRTPGMSPRLPELTEVINKGKMTSLTKLFFDHCRAGVIGVTGTKGKGTVSTLIAEMLRASGRKAWLGGNVGTPLLSKVHDIAPHDIVVLELSSFQLEDLHKSPQIAVVLRVTQEHLANFDPQATNYHESRTAYVEAKQSIVRYQTRQDAAVLLADDPTSSSFAKLTPAKIYYFSREHPTADAYINAHAVFLRWKGKPHRICHMRDIELRGMHNLENITAASLAAAVAGASVDPMKSAATSFRGLEHRLEFVRSVGGVAYYNDSFSTTPETAIAAIKSFYEPIHLVVGGSDKGSDYTQLGEEIAKANIKTVIIIGAMTDRILEAVKNAGFCGRIITGLTSMHDIVRALACESSSGDVALLSPACASFDMFKNYKERGALFKHEVSLL